MRSRSLVQLFLCFTSFSSIFLHTHRNNFITCWLVQRTTGNIVDMNILWRFDDIITIASNLLSSIGIFGKPIHVSEHHSSSKRKSAKIYYMWRHGADDSLPERTEICCWFSFWSRMVLRQVNRFSKYSYKR